MSKNRRRTSARLLFCVLLLLAPVSAFPQAKRITDLRPTVILVSLDGFRFDYLDKYKPTNLNQLAHSGVRARWMTPSFPSKTFPNHYTIADRALSTKHGLVENNIYDAKVRENFHLSDRQEIEKVAGGGVSDLGHGAAAGTKNRIMFYPGTEAEIMGKRPGYWQPIMKKYQMMNRRPNFAVARSAGRSPAYLSRALLQRHRRRGSCAWSEFA